MAIYDLTLPCQSLACGTAPPWSLTGHQVSGKSASGRDNPPSSRARTPPPADPYTVRYGDTFGSHREKSLTTRKEAQTFVTDTERGKRYGEDVNLAAARERFTMLSSRG